MGKGIANPVACIRSGAMLLEYFGEQERANKIFKAVDKSLADGVTTPDLGGKATTKQVVQEIIKNLGRV